MIKRVHILVSGRVQGVCFRMYSQSEANAIGLSGWVRNRPDGSVEIMAEGNETKLQSFVKWCAHGPSYASVEDVQVSWDEAQGGISGFNITY